MERRIITLFSIGRLRRQRPPRAALLAAVLLAALALGLCGCGTAPEQAAPPPTEPRVGEIAASPDEKPAVPAGDADTERDRTAPVQPSGEPAGQAPAAPRDGEPAAAPGDPRPDPGERTVTLWVTRDFGRQILLADEVPLPPGATALSVLQSHARVETAYGGGFVNAVNGLRSEGRGGRRDWLLWVNGVLSPVGGADCRPEPGDVVWWDYRDWSGGPPAPAAVGAFPQPFLSRGCRVLFPPGREDDARALASSLRTYGITPELGPLTGEEVTARRTPLVAVGLRQELAACRPLAGLLDRGPRAGAYCRLEPDWIVALGAGGREAARYGAGCGAVIALAGGPGEGAPVWVVAGVDEEGLARALEVFKDAAALQRRCGLAVTPGGPVPLPLPGE